MIMIDKTCTGSCSCTHDIAKLGISYFRRTRLTQIYPVIPPSGARTVATEYGYTMPSCCMASVMDRHLPAGLPGTAQYHRTPSLG